MGFDLLSLGSQGVLTTQRQLNTTGHNINNVNTEGYSRQQVVQQANDARFWGGNAYGDGVHIESVRRLYDQFAVRELNHTTTQVSHFDELDNGLGIVNNLLSQSGSKVPQSMNDWYEAIKALADSPNDMGSRKVLFEQGKLFAANMNDVYSTLQQQYFDSNQEIHAAVDRVNGLANELRDINHALMSAPTGTANDLLDRHDSLIKELSQYTRVSENRREDGGFNILIGSGHNLVSGPMSSELRLVPGHPDSQQLAYALVEGKSLKTIQTDGIDGRLAALSQYRDKVIPKVMDQLGRMSIAFSDQVNALQKQGITLKNDVGGDMFTDVNDPKIAASRALVPADSKTRISVYIDDVNALKSGEYALKFDGSEYHVKKPDGKTITVTPTGTPPTFNLDGLRVEMSTPPEVGEKILLRPTRTGAQDIAMVMKDAADIAAQAFVGNASHTLGGASLEVKTVGPLKQFHVALNDTADKFNVLDMQGNLLLANQPYPPTGNVNVGGTVFSLSSGGHPQDLFTINMELADGDNSNLLTMQQLQTKKTTDDHRSTIVDLYQAITTEIGVDKSTVDKMGQVAKAENNAAAERVAAVSGVNLDEEAANLMKFQQAYMASSRIMTAANETFDALLNATR